LKAVVGFGFFMLFLAAFAFVMLQGKQMAQSGIASGGIGLTSARWRPTKIHGEAVDADSGMFVTFSVDGSINGNGGCNGFFGSLEKSDTGLSVGPLGSTRMACAEQVMDREMEFIGALQGMKDVNIGDFGMRLLDDNGNIIAEFVAESAE